MRPNRDTGSAIVGFVATAAWLCLLALLLIQLTIALHVKNVATDAAGQGARQGALFDASLSSGAQRAAEVARVALGSHLIRQVEAEQISLEFNPRTNRPVQVVEVHMRVAIPAIGMWLGVGEVQVRGRAIKESY